jgi:hypothetical protein
MAGRTGMYYPRTFSEASQKPILLKQTERNKNIIIIIIIIRTSSRTFLVARFGDIFLLEHDYMVQHESVRRYLLM